MPEEWIKGWGGIEGGTHGYMPTSPLDGKVPINKPAPKPTSKPIV